MIEQYLFVLSDIYGKLLSNLGRKFLPSSSPASSSIFLLISCLSLSKKKINLVEYASFSLEAFFFFVYI